MVFFFGIPDLRVDIDSLCYPKHTYKSEILNPKKKRDFLTNLYFSTPDYQESNRKVFYSAYLGAKMATLSAFLEVSAMKSRNPQVALEIVARNFYFIGGFTLMYGSVATAVANLRGQKDDIWNHGIAGASWGFPIGYYFRSSAYGTIGGAAGFFFGLLFKQWFLSEHNVFGWSGQGEINFMHGGEEADYRITKTWLNSHDTKTRRERYH